MRRGFKAKPIAKFAIFLMLGALCIRASYAQRWIFTPPEAASAATAKPRPPMPDVIGNLGGVPVTIPGYMPRLVEYEGDPGWGGKWKGPLPVRTHASVITSFGIDLKLPDMKALPPAEELADKRLYTIRNSPWFSVGVKSGSAYPGDGWVERGVRADLNRPPSQVRVWGSFEKVASEIPGLEQYALRVTPLPNAKYPQRGEDLYVARDAKGVARAAILCSHPAVHGGISTCRHDFSLEPEMKAQVYMHYRKDYLNEWQSIEAGVRSVMGSFLKPTAERLAASGRTN